MEKINHMPELKHSNLEKKPNLAAVPIFRSNDLYDTLFPEFEPLFKKGEDPNFKRIIDSIKNHSGKEVILDETCRRAIASVSVSGIKVEDLPAEFKLKKIPEDAGQMDMVKISKLFKKNFDVTLSQYNTIDRKIAKVLDCNFSPDLVKSLLEIAKQKNADIKRVYILSDNLADHVGDFPKDQVLEVLREKVQSELGVTPIIVPTFDYHDIQKGDHIIFDRHNHFMGSLVDVETYTLPKDLSLQFSLLPLETELHNNEQFGDKKIESSTLVKTLRKSFETAE